MMVLLAYCSCHIKRHMWWLWGPLHFNPSGGEHVLPEGTHSLPDHVTTFRDEASSLLGSLTTLAGLIMFFMLFFAFLYFLTVELRIFFVSWQVRKDYNNEYFHSFCSEFHMYWCKGNFSTLVIFHCDVNFMIWHLRILAMCVSNRCLLLRMGWWLKSLWMNGWRNSLHWRPRVN